MQFKVEAVCRDTNARAGVLSLPNGDVDTPVFMPVGTNATVKTLLPSDIEELGYSLILSNTYHLYLRPGEDVITRAQGLHSFMSFKGNILTDSGGFQVYSLARFRKMHDDGVEFRSHIDGSLHYFTPEKVVNIQKTLGSQIMMPLDECTAAGVGYETAKQAEERTYQWAVRSKEEFDRRCDPDKQSIFAIIQGNMFRDLRKISLERLADLDFPGYAIGGLSVGEHKDDMYGILSQIAPNMPSSKPRYLMGVGEPVDLLNAVEHGIDMFDCVLPTRNARNASVFTLNGIISLRNERFKSDFSPIDETCGCTACKNFSLSYMRHLFKTKEILGLILATKHNLYFLKRLMDGARDAVKNGAFTDFKKKFIAKYKK
ncbi:MAG: tRNA guanosine(34) transglycosylase Tgt [Spirochaetes bacterium]|nr:tRNA guanosine(34) transglycosylase Tgt [Spirochaetota bacterium]